MLTPQPSLSPAPPEALPRPDVDIEEEISQIVRRYPPLQSSRTYLHYRSENGKVTFWGNVRSPQALRYLLVRVPHVAGVNSIEASELFDDDTVTVAIGAKLPEGVYVTVYFGAVMLTGNLPSAIPEEKLVEAVKAVPGVRRVNVRWDNSTKAAGASSSL